MDKLSPQARGVLFCAVAVAFVYALNKFRAQDAGPQQKTSGNTESSQNFVVKSKLTFLHNLTFVHKARPLSSAYPSLLVCFGTYCGPCKAEVPHIARISREYTNFNVVAASAEPKDKIQRFIDENPQCKAYSVASDEAGYTRTLMEHHGVQGIPHCFLFDEKGDLVWNGHPARVDPELKKVARSVSTQFSGKARRL